MHVSCPPTSATYGVNVTGASNTAIDLTIQTPDGPMGLHVRKPAGDGPFPVVVFFHHGPGLDVGSKQAMQWIADAGYYVVSHDRYHRHGEWLVWDMSPNPTQGSGSTDLARMFEILLGTDDGMVASDLGATLSYMESEPAASTGPMGCIGYCIGARSVLPTIVGDPDRFTVGQPLIDATNALTPRGLAEIHDGANHGFGVPGHAYHNAAADRSYASAFAMFDSALRS